MRESMGRERGEEGIYGFNPDFIHKYTIIKGKLPPHSRLHQKST